VLWWSQGRLTARVAIAVCHRAADCVVEIRKSRVIGVSLAGGCSRRRRRPQQGDGGDR